MPINVMPCSHSSVLGRFVCSNCVLESAPVSFLSSLKQIIQIKSNYQISVSSGSRVGGVLVTNNTAAAAADSLLTTKRGHEDSTSRARCEHCDDVFCSV